MPDHRIPGVNVPGIVMLVKMPIVTMTPKDPLAAEMLEHWAAKLLVRGDPGDVEEAEKVQDAARQFRAWQRENPSCQS